MPKSKFSSAPKVILDARKFLGSINKKSFAGQINLVEKKLGRLAKEFDTKLRLVAHFGDQIYFEDVNENCYYQADLSKGKNGRTFHIDNIQQVVIEDNEKSKVFDDACFSLVESIEAALDDGDATKSNSIFENIVRGHCTPNVIPESGIVSTWDGNRHYINITENTISEDVYPKVVDALKEAVNNSDVVIKEGSITIGENTIKLPISETTRRLSVARNMKTVAENAHSSDNFNRLMKTVAGHISNNNNKDVVGLLKSFLTEDQEFTMLDKKGVYQLVENSLYGQGIFNYKIVRNTALMFWETNCHLNKGDIVKEWSITASKCGNKQLKENIEILKESISKGPMAFSDSFDKFLGKIFNEDSSTRVVKAKAYLNMLKMLNNIVGGSDADAPIKSSVDDLVMRLESNLNNVDDATLFEVEDLLATVSADLIHDTSTLADFDTIPEPMAADQFGTDDDVGDFEGDMGGDDSAGGMGGMGGMGDMGGDIGGGVDAEADAALDDVEGIEDEEEVEDDELQLSDVMRKAKPISEMKAADVKVVLEAIQNMKPEVVEVEGEFKKLLKKGLTESEVTFIKNVMTHSKSIDDALFEGMTSAYYDLVISEDVAKEEPAADPYAFDGTGDVNINDDYAGIKEEDDKKDKTFKGGKSEAGVEGAEEDGKEATEAVNRKKLKKGGKAEAGLAGAEEDGKEATESANQNANAIKEDDDEDCDDDDKKDDKKDDDKVEEGKSIAIVADDEALINIISKVLEDPTDGISDLPMDDGMSDMPIDGMDDGMDDVDDGMSDDGMQDGEELIVGDEDETDLDDDSMITDEDDAPDFGNEDDDDAVKEDNNISDPDKGDYDSEKAASQNGDGDKINDKPTFSDKDYDGTKGAKTAKQKPSAGHPSA